MQRLLAKRPNCVMIVKMCFGNKWMVMERKFQFKIQMENFYIQVLYKLQIGAHIASVRKIGKLHIVVPNAILIT